MKNICDFNITEAIKRRLLRKRNKKRYGSGSGREKKTLKLVTDVKSHALNSTFASGLSKYNHQPHSPERIKSAKEKIVAI
jgi:hypothetical protein